MERFDREISVPDVLSARAKSWDVDASSVLLEAPSISREAEDIARSYRFHIVVAPARKSGDG